MPKEFSRQNRVADQIHHALAQLIQTELGDPRIGMVNINQVDVSRDYANARVFVTFVDTNADTNAAIKALNHAAKHLRHCLAKSLNSRTTPRLQFVYDSTSVEGQRLSHLIDKAVKADNRESDDS